jgi:hypothetical protein
VAGITALTTGLAGQQQARSATPITRPASAGSSASLALPAVVTGPRCLNICIRPTLAARIADP